MTMPHPRTPLTAGEIRDYFCADVLTGAGLVHGHVHISVIAASDAFFIVQTSVNAERVEQNCSASDDFVIADMIARGYATLYAHDAFGGPFEDNCR